MRLRRRVVVVTAVAVVAEAAGAGIVLTMTPHGSLGLAGAWRDAEGRVLPDGGDDGSGELVVKSYSGASHCDKDTVIFLEFTWPVGTEVGSKADVADRTVRTFARDPDSALQSPTSAAFAVVDATPVTSIDTGMSRWGNSLVVDPGGDAYVTRLDGSIERWPLVTRVQGCD